MEWNSFQNNECQHDYRFRLADNHEMDEGLIFVMWMFRHGLSVSIDLNDSARTFSFHWFQWFRVDFCNSGDFCDSARIFVILLTFIIWLWPIWFWCFGISCCDSNDFWDLAWTFVIFMISMICCVFLWLCWFEVGSGDSGRVGDLAWILWF